MKIARIVALSLTMVAVASASAAPKAKVKKIPDVVFFDRFAGDTVTMAYEDAAPFIYEKDKFMELNTATLKFLTDEMLLRYQTVTDDCIRRAAFNRMKEFRRPISSNPPLLGIRRSAQDCYMSQDLYTYLTDSLIAYSRELAEAGKIKSTDLFRTTRWESTMYLREPRYLEPVPADYQVFLLPLKINKTPICIDDTMGFVDYKPEEFRIYRFMDVKAAEPWIEADMVAKYRFFAHVVRNSDGLLVQTSDAEALHLSPEVFGFFTRVLEGLNDPSTRVHSPAADWTDNPDQAEKMAREFFLAKNRGHSSKIYNGKGKLKKFYDPSPSPYSI